MRQIRMYRGRLSAIIWYGSGCSNTLLMPCLRLAQMYRRRMMRSLAFDRDGFDAVVEEVSW